MTDVEQKVPAAGKVTAASSFSGDRGNKSYGTAHSLVGRWNRGWKTPPTLKRTWKRLSEFFLRD